MTSDEVNSYPRQLLYSIFLGVSFLCFIPLLLFVYSFFFASWSYGEGTFYMHLFSLPICALVGIVCSLLSFKPIPRISSVSRPPSLR